MNTETKLAAAIEAVESTLAHHQAIYTNGRALASRAEIARVDFMNRIMSTSGDGTPLNIPRGWVEVETILDSAAVKSYISAQSIAQAVTSSPEFLEAHAIIEPLVAEVRRLESDLAAEREAAGILANERRAAIEKATAEALAEVEARFAETPAPEEAAPRFRGRVKLEGDPVLA